MTYITFHLIFTLPLTLVLAITLPASLKESQFWTRWSVPLLALVAFLYTTPWDNYLVANGIWLYGPDRVIGTIGYVPYEEYFFFLIQPILTGCWLLHVLYRLREQPGPRNHVARWVGTTFFGAATLLGIWLLTGGDGRGTYLGLILVWAAPVCAGQWAIAGQKFGAVPRTFIACLLPATLYLWFADRTAIKLGIWTIAPETSFNLSLFGLPVEEAVFFLITNLLVVQGVLMLLDLEKYQKEIAALTPPAAI